MKMTKINFGKPTLRQEKGNIKAYRDILDDFFYTRSTVKRLRKATRPLLRDWKHCYADRVFNVNARDLRVWYKLDVDAESDRAYREYMRYMHTASGHPYVYKYNLRSYEVFKSGRVQVGKQEIKLFKFILNNGILPEFIVERITTLKNNNRTDLYLCISRNPVDMMLCSTGQPFSSCMSWDSDCSYWLSTGALAADPNRAIAFITKGDLHGLNVKGCHFSHFRYLQRNFLHLVNNDTIYVDREYPSTSYDMADLLKDAGYKATMDRGPRYTSRFNFIPPRIQDTGNSDAIALPYFDYIGYSLHQSKIVNGKKRLRCTLDTTGAPGCPFDFPFTGGFENLHDIEDLYCDGEDFINCEECGDRVHMEDAFSGPDDCWYCAGCFRDIFDRCDRCGDYTAKEDMEHTEDGPVCQHCFDRHFSPCNECGDIYCNDDMEEGDGGIYCESCFDDLFTEECPECRESVREDHMMNCYNGQSYCETCFERKIDRAYNLMPFFHGKKQLKVYRMWIRSEITLTAYINYKNTFSYAA